MADLKQYEARINSEGATTRRITDAEAVKRAYDRLTALGRSVGAAKPTPNK